MQKSKIEWTDYVWNPLTGCEHGCSYCYARKMANRLKGRYGYPPENGFIPTKHPERTAEPLKIIKPSKIFVCSMGDLFGDWVDNDFIADVIYTAQMCPRHTFIFLTKNPKRYNDFDFPNNTWLGYSTEGTFYHKWDERHTNNIKFVSIEPMRNPLYIPLEGFAQRININWIIVGQETGNRKGKTWVSSEMLQEVKDFTDKTGIPLFLKNNLKYHPIIQEYPREDKA